jgi:hypothetical protein
MSDTTKKNVATPKHQPPAGYEKVIVDMPSFKAEPFSEREAPGSPFQVYTGQPLQGEILGARSFGEMKNPDGTVMTNEDGEATEQIALLVKVEADVECIGRDKKPVTAKPGTDTEQVLWFATEKVWQAIVAKIGLPRGATKEENNRLRVLAMNGPYGLKFWCMPLKQEQHPKNPKFKMWTYDFRLHPDVVKRTGSAGMAQFFAHAQPALPAASATPTTTVLAGTANGARA